MLDPTLAPGGGTIPPAPGGWGAAGVLPVFFSPKRAFRSLISRAPGRFEVWLKAGPPVWPKGKIPATKLSKGVASMDYSGRSVE